MAMPLYDLIKKGVVVATEWDETIHGEACQKIKDALTSRPVLMQVDNPLLQQQMNCINKEL